MIESTTSVPAGATPAEPKAVGLPRLSTPRKQPQDTEQGCRDFAAADLVRSAEHPSGMSRQRLEHSAASWTKRAELLHKVEAGWNAAHPS